MVTMLRGRLPDTGEIRNLLRTLCMLILVGVTAPAAGQVGDWYVPMADLVAGGFDHIQILAPLPYGFDEPAMSAFFGEDAEGELVPAGEQWGQMFVTDKLDFASATGPNLGAATLFFDVWMAGDRLVDRPMFHYQTYREGALAGNWDVQCIGPGDLDWIVEVGTWTIGRAFLFWPPGDADLDGDVDLDDFVLLKINFGTGDTWGEGDFDGDGNVDLDDFVILKNNFGTTALPEPTTLALLGVGAAALLRRRGGH